MNWKPGFLPPTIHGIYGGFLKIGDPEVTMGFNIKKLSNDLDDLRVTPF